MLPAIGLAYEVKETAIMSRPPRRVGKDNLVRGCVNLSQHRRPRSLVHPLSTNGLLKAGR